MPSAVEKKKVSAYSVKCMRVHERASSAHRPNTYCSRAFASAVADGLNVDCKCAEANDPNGNPVDTKRRRESNCIFYHVLCVCMCVCVCMCAHMCVCV